MSIEDMLALSALVHDTHDDDNALFGKAMHQLRDLLDADRAVLYLFDAAEGVLWTPVADGGSVLKVPVGTGLVGHTAASGDIVSVAGAVKYYHSGILAAMNVHLLFSLVFASFVADSFAVTVSCPFLAAIVGLCAFLLFVWVSLGFSF